MKRFVTLFLIATAMLALACWWSYDQLRSSREEALCAANDLDACQRYVAQIKSLKDRPSFASGAELLASETTSLIESAAQGASIPANKLLRITPEQPQRVGESPYKEKPTVVLLRDVSLAQVADLAYRLSVAPQPLTAKSLRLTAPQIEDVTDSWSAELVVTYLIFAPVANK